MNKKYLKKISDYTVVGGLGAVLLVGLSGCEDKGISGQGQGGNNAAFTSASQKEGAFVIIEKRPDGGYTIADEFPASKTTIVLRNPDGTERILSQAEIDALVAEEAKKIDNGTSNLTKDQAEISNGGLGLGEVLLSSIAGALIGSYIGNKLFNNNNYKAQRKSNYKNPSTYSRSVNSFNKAKTGGTSGAKSSSGKSGFFGNSKSSSSSKSRSFFGG